MAGNGRPTCLSRRRGQAAAQKKAQGRHMLGARDYNRHWVTDLGGFMNPVSGLSGRLFDWRHRRFVALGNRFREQRVRFFVEQFVEDAETILDVGYGYGQFEDALTRLGLENRVIALDIVPRDVSRHRNISAFVLADVTNLPFADQSIDVIYCNSIIEHVGDRQVQRRALAEIARVGRKFFVQTPYRHFPIEPHHLLPFFQYFPRSVQQWLGRKILGHYELVWLLDRSDARELASIDTRIAVWEEKVLGLTKSLAFYRNVTDP